MKSEGFIERIKEQLSVVEVVGQYVDLTKAGRNYRGLCPFHEEKTPSFNVSEERGLFKCFGCGAGGDAIAFVSKIKHLSYTQAAVELAKNANVVVDEKTLKTLRAKDAKVQFDKEFAVLTFLKDFFYYCFKEAKEAKEARDYMASRTVEEPLINHFEIGYVPQDVNLIINRLESNKLSVEMAVSAGVLAQKETGDYYSLFQGRVVFPIKNVTGQVVGFSGRKLQTDTSDSGKYLNSPETALFKKSEILYHLDVAEAVSQKTKRLFLFEGFMDVISAVSAGFHESVAALGTALTSQHVALLKKYSEHVVLCYDADKAGLAATKKATVLLFAHNIRISIAVFPEGMDPDDYLKQRGKEAFKQVLESSVGALDFEYAQIKSRHDMTSSDGKTACIAEIEAFCSQIGNKELLYRFFSELKGQKTTASFKGKQATSLLQAPTVSSQALFTVSGAHKAERELLYYMLHSKAAFLFIKRQMKQLFHDQTHRQLMAAIETHYNSYETIDLFVFSQTIDEGFKKLVDDIVNTHDFLEKECNETVLYELLKRCEAATEKKIFNVAKQKMIQSSKEEQLVLLTELTTNHVK